jgi:hypothetical protein
MPVHGRHQKIAGTASAIARKHASRTVRAVRGGRQPENQHARVRIAKSRYGFRPVRITAKCRPFDARDFLAIGPQPRALIAADDVLMNLPERHFFL